MAERPMHSPDREEMVEKYVRLSRQSEKVRRRLSLSIPSTSPLSPPSEYETPSPTPKRRRSSSSYPFGFCGVAVSAYPRTAQPPQHDPAEEEHLFDLNQQIKATLTELMNCEEVKHDKKFRAWVQMKLMEAEHEIKKHRRRKSSVDDETLKAFEEHLGTTPAFAHRATY